MRNKFPELAFVMIFLSGCGNPDSLKNKQTDTIRVENAADTHVPGIEKIMFSDTVALEANEYMRFNKDLFRVKTGKKLTLILKNTSSSQSGMSMDHNAVILVRGTDIADFADAVKNAKAENYVPSSVAPLIIAHTKTISGGQTDIVEFSIPQAGVYDFICSFPGHWGSMQGKIVAE